jgi:hypothetical protein
MASVPASSIAIVVAYLLDDCGVPLDCENQPPPPGESEGIAALPISSERVQVEAGKIEQLAELADVADRGDAAKIGPADVVAPLPVRTALLLGATLKLPRAKLDVQVDSAFR